MRDRVEAPAHEDSGSGGARGGDLSAVGRAVSGLREMINGLILAPGQPIRQEEIAARLLVSRAPIREALRILQSEGILKYEPNIGYSVRRFSSSEFRQIYLMRHSLETEVLLSLPPLSRTHLRKLRAQNAEMAAAGSSGDVDRMRELNKEWHFSIFEQSEYGLILVEIERLWNVSHPYRSFYLHDASARELVVQEHDSIIDALASRDLKTVATLMDEHRNRVPDKLDQLLTFIPFDQRS